MPTAPISPPNPKAIACEAPHTPMRTPSRVRLPAPASPIIDPMAATAKAPLKNPSAATLAVNYKKISPVDFSHSNIISLFNEDGELIYQQEGLGVDYAPTIKAIEEAANKL